MCLPIENLLDWFRTFCSNQTKIKCIAKNKHASLLCDVIYKSFSLLVHSEKACQNKHSSSLRAFVHYRCKIVLDRGTQVSLTLVTFFFETSKPQANIYYALVGLECQA
jgi:hypothetical protein